MKVERELLEDNRVCLDIQVEKDVVNKALQQAYRKIVKDVKLPGFRHGKVPRSIIEARFGKEVLYKDAIDIIIDDILPEVLSEQRIDLIERPELTNVEILENETAQIKLTVEIPPEAQLGQYTGFDIEKKTIEIELEQIDKHIDGLRNQYATLIVSQRDTVQEGDFVLIDFEGFLDGIPFDGGSSTDYMLGIGSNTFIPGFEEQLIDTKLGEEKELHVTFPEEYKEDLAGKDVVFNVKIKEIKEKDLPPADDVFAKMVGEYETIEELKQDIQEKLEQDAENKVMTRFEDEVLNTVAENATVDIPEKMINNRLEGLFQEMSSMYKHSGINFEEYLQRMGASNEELMASYRSVAERQVRNRLVLDAVVKAKNFTAEEADLDAEIIRVTNTKEEHLSVIKESLKKNGSFVTFVGDILRKKALDFLLEENEKKEV